MKRLLIGGQRSGEFVETHNDWPGDVLFIPVVSDTASTPFDYAPALRDPTWEKELYSLRRFALFGARFEAWVLDELSDRDCDLVVGRLLLSAAAIQAINYSWEDS